MDDLFVGRQEEMDVLVQLYESVAQNESAGVCFISGEAGLGKSSLINNYLADEIHQQHSSLILRAGGVSNTALNEPYLTIKELLDSLTRNLQEEQTHKDAAMGVLIRATEDLINYAPDLIGSLIPGWKLVEKISSCALEYSGVLEKVKDKISQSSRVNKLDENKISEQFCQFLQGVAGQNRVHIVIDDMQWVDLPSLALLQKLLNIIKEYPVFCIFAFRGSELSKEETGSRHPLNQLINNCQAAYGNEILDLDSLSNDRKKEISSCYLGALVPGVSVEFQQQFHLSTDGHPLHCKELLLMLKESGVVQRNASGAWVAETLTLTQMPTAMTGVIRERVERLDTRSRSLLDIAAVQGEQFYLTLLSQVSGEAIEDVLFQFAKVLSKQLNLVEEVDLITVAGKVLIRYQFSHKLVQNYLYEELSKGEKQLLHMRTANEYENLFKSCPDRELYKIGYHFDHAMQYDKAYRYYLEAADNAYKLGAYKSAVRLLEGVLQRLPYFPDDSDPIAAEFEVLLRLSTAYIAQKGYGAPEVGAISARAELLRKERQDDSSMFELLWKRWSNVIMKADFEQASWVCTRLLALADDPNANSVIRLEAAHAQGVTDFNLGRFSESRVAFLSALEGFNPDNREQHIEKFGNDPQLLLLSWLSWVSLIQGDLEDSEKYQCQLDDCINESNHSSSNAFALVFKAMWYLFQERANDALAVADSFLQQPNMDILFWEYWASIIKKWAEFKTTGNYRSPEMDIKKFIMEGGAIWGPFMYALWGEMCQDTNPEQATICFSVAEDGVNPETPLFHNVPILIRLLAWLKLSEDNDCSRVEQLVSTIVSAQKADFWSEQLHK